MQITIKENSIGVGHLYGVLYQAVNLTDYFTVEIEQTDFNKLKLKNVRLKEKRPYCGNHPNACDVTVGRRERSYNYLEGTDWVSFNDLVNDVCDLWSVNANIYTSVCWLRKGNQRRIRYGSSKIRMTNFYQWDNKGEDSDYGIYLGRLAPPSEYPYGTPGEYRRWIDDILTDLNPPVEHIVWDRATMAYMEVDDEVESWRDIINAGKKVRNFDGRTA